MWSIQRSTKLLLFMLPALLVLSRVFAEIAERLDQPVLVGELVADSSRHRGTRAPPAVQSERRTHGLR